VFDSQAFRRALGNFATGITVITTVTPEGENVGLTANSFNSVSLDPPLILWSLDKRSNNLDAFNRASHFAVNILAADQMDLSNQFARPSDNKFEGVNFREGLGGAAVLADCAAVFECSVHQLVDAGDHIVLIGRVEQFEAEGRAPLCYHQGGYSIVMPYSRLTAESSQSKPSDGDSKTPGRLNTNLYYLMLQAMRSYQADYLPLQMSTGLQTSEARMLMILTEHQSLDAKQLVDAVAMPEQDVRLAVEVLERKGLISEANGIFSISVQGHEKSDALWHLASEEQERVFAKFSDDEIATFSKVLKGLIN
jgi:flavin reductase (DIM6/NTAB) family NADH-FMN oxidoreductase RutF/DNA-binding MarR family transcriptional regulator